MQQGCWAEVVKIFWIIFCHESISTTIKIKESALQWQFFVSIIYASPQSNKRHSLWECLSLIVDNMTRPWILSGHFNSILSMDEWKGGVSKRAWGCSHFQSFFSNNHLCDLGSMDWNSHSVRAICMRG